MPAQPPFFTPTRTPANGLSAFAMMSLMRDAAASVSRITWGRGLAVAILILSTCYDLWRIHDIRNAFVVYLGVVFGRRNSPHVQRGARLVGHPALLPWWIPHDVDRHRADARNARYRILHHDRQFLRRRTVWRRERHVHGDRAVIRDVDLVDQAELINIRGNLRVINGLQRAHDVVGNASKLFRRQRAAGSGCRGLRYGRRGFGLDFL